MKEFEQADSYIARVKQSRKSYLSFVAITIPVLVLFVLSYSVATTSFNIIFCFIIGTFSICVWIGYKISIAFPMSPEPFGYYNGCRYYGGDWESYRCIWCGNWYELTNTGETCSSRYHAKQLANFQKRHNHSRCKGCD